MLNTDPFRTARARHGHHVRPRCRLDLLEDLVIGSQVSHVRVGDRSVCLRIFLIGEREGDQAIVVRIGQRTQKKRIDGAEDRRGAADSQSQRQHGDQSKSGTLAESASRVAQVLPQRLRSNPQWTRCGPCRECNPTNRAPTCLDTTPPSFAVLPRSPLTSCTLVPIVLSRYPPVSASHLRHALLRTSAVPCNQ